MLNPSGLVRLVNDSKLSTFVSKILNVTLVSGYPIQGITMRLIGHGEYLQVKRVESVHRIQVSLS